MLEKVCWMIAFLMPRRLVYFCAIRLVAYATQGEYGDTVVPDLPVMDALDRWSSRK